MGVLSVTYQLDDGDQSAEDLESGGGQERYDVVFEGNEDPSSRKFLARNAPGIPPMLSFHIFDPFIYVVQKTARPIAVTPLHWVVTVTYKSIQNPLEQAPQEQWLFAATRDQVDRALLVAVQQGTDRTVKNLDDFPIMNSVGEMADPPALKDHHDIIYSHVRNEAFYNRDHALKFKNAINKVVWKTFPVGTVKLEVLSAIKMRAANLIYWQVTYEFHIRDTGWTEFRVDKGFRTIKRDPESDNPIIVDGKLQYETIKDADGIQLSEPTLLDGEGRILPDGEDNVAFEYSHNTEEDFTDLGIVMTA